MAQNISDADATVVHLPEQGGSAESSLPFPAVAVAKDRQAPRNIAYIAQQTSLEDYTPGLNPLVNAAAHLLLEMVRLKHGQTEDIEGLRARLEAEIRGFEAQALASEMDHSHVLAARYVLCTAMDESVTTSKLGESGGWSRLALLSTFHNETWGGEKFFQILDRCMQQPARNLYLLELMYLLLSLGFEGRYRVLDRGPIALESLRDKIYRQVRLLRGEPSPDLSKKIEVGGYKDRIYAYIPVWLVACMVFFCLAATFWGFSHLLANRADPLLERYSAHLPKGVKPETAPIIARPVLVGRGSPEAETAPAPASDPAPAPEQAASPAQGATPGANPGATPTPAASAPTVKPGEARP